MLISCFEVVFSYFQNLLFDGLDDCHYIENKYPFYQNNSDSQHYCDNQKYFILFNGHKTTRRNIAFC